MKLPASQQLQFTDCYRDAVNQYFNDIFSRLPRNTQRAYISDFNEFVIFCEQSGLSGFNASFENNELCVKRYVEMLCQSPLAYRTIKRRLSALSKFLGIAKLPNPIVQSVYLRDFIRLSLAENEKYQFSHHQAVPLTLDLLEKINERVIPDTLLEMRDLAMINLMFDALLRADEVVRVCISDINKRTNALLVLTSKSDQTGKGQYRYISPNTLDMIDGYMAEANYDPHQKVERSEDDPRRINKGVLFRRVSNRGHALLPYDEDANFKQAPKLEYSSIYRTWKRIAALAGIQENITPHSGRVGAAVSLAENGATLPEMQLAGGWRSPEMPGHYGQQAAVKQGGMARLTNGQKRRG
ncbi:tyrosine-type recombinase/integrase [Alteromonas sp. 1_MG-2023]|uniref:tyrosine-type recombinase/integrase n=1 Tax=Alteromonas sp. 1_MG-2023 TaxID=3062669 RepID=UPI0026E22085|nr:tyrosine-type recombinase/integrase [Alteromonas sp. 1_MG-2023]MDO6477379.1 tyrosine-type recombinase/integrase [Alteromonas sp. 1_MG-2023]